MLLFAVRQQRNEYEQFISPYVNHLFGLACRFSQNREDAEDITQDLLIKLFTQQHKLFALENPRPYLCRAVYNQYVDYMRRQGKHLNAVDVDVELQATNAASSSPETSAELDITIDTLNNALGKLSADHRAIIVLHDMEGFTYDEISELLKIATGTAKSRQHRARATLKTKLVKQ